MTPTQALEQQELLSKLGELQQKISQTDSFEKINQIRILLERALEIINKNKSSLLDPSAMINEAMCCDDNEITNEVPSSIQTHAPTLLFHQQPAATAPSSTPNVASFDEYEATMRKLRSFKN